MSKGIYGLPPMKPLWWCNIDEFDLSICRNVTEISVTEKLTDKIGRVAPKNATDIWRHEPGKPSTQNGARDTD